MSGHNTRFATQRRPELRVSPEQEAIFRVMMLAYNLFLLFKIDMVKTIAYRKQIKTFRLKHIFLVSKIIRTARSVVMNLSDRYPYREMYEKSLS